MDKDENSKQRILNAATHLFAHKGFAATGIREICRKARVNICMISYYWGGKKELYQGIIQDLIEKQTAYAGTFTDLSLNTAKLSKQEQINLLMLTLDKVVDFLYSKISSDLIILLLKEQQKSDWKVNSPVFYYLKKLIADIFEKDTDCKEIIFKTVFILSQINSPRVLSAFTLGQLKQKKFTEEDILIIKENVKFYVKLLLKEAGIV